jgi:hypothetical protein
MLKKLIQAQTLVVFATIPCLVVSTMLLLCSCTEKEVRDAKLGEVGAVVGAPFGPAGIAIGAAVGNVATLVLQLLAHKKMNNVVREVQTRGLIPNDADLK